MFRSSCLSDIAGSVFKNRSSRKPPASENLDELVMHNTYLSKPVFNVSTELFNFFQPDSFL